MNRLRGCALLILCFFSVFVLTVRYERPDLSLSVSDTLRRTFSFSATYWDKAKTMISQAQAHLFPSPNLDFRGSETDRGAGEKVKEAVAESLGKTKATVEDSAKSAANIVKRSLSNRREESDSDEL
ncbi:hypothetical protein JCGZ_22591 [Jatropha curcas]|uniref:Transmembrane protein n=1 Tax=Jatropha curcas TaxID=180498 RepID=A0A067JM40_JATCU|nr:uncharacterized protein LOC105646152 [Jatropha curcas]KDP25056.1 hypothetical protein JCGZ_22591 [Jatropha curcas]